MTSLSDGALIWANADMLVLFVDGVQHSKLFPSLDSQFLHLRYPPFVAAFTQEQQGKTLQIDAYRQGALVHSLNMSSLLSSVSFVAEADHVHLSADGLDMTRVSFYLTDEFGNLQPDDQSANVAISVSGNAGYAVSLPVPFSFPGSFGAIYVRSSGGPGSISVRLVHSVYGSKDITIFFK